MKLMIIVLVFTVATISYCQDNVNAGLSADQVIDIIKQKNPTATCISLDCKISCMRQGYKAGYCALGSCTCIPASTA